MRRDWDIAVYMVTNKPYGTLYIGVTSHLLGRIIAHREGRFDGFTRKYGLTRLVWYQGYDYIANAIRAEKSLKCYRRDWKINLIERANPHWLDLFPRLTEGAPAHLWVPPPELPRIPNP